MTKPGEKVGDGESDGPASGRVLMSRRIRQRTLEALTRVHNQCAGMGVTFEDLYRVLRRIVGPMGWTDDDIRGELLELADAGMVIIDQQAVKSTARGRDFLRAGCPWRRIDEFSGDQEII